MNIEDNYKKLIPSHIRQALKLCSEVAKEQNTRIYLIGGAVRDVAMNKCNFDTDITVEGNAIEFGRVIEKNFPDICQIKSIHSDFGTIKVVFKIDNREIDIDIASTRKESYPKPAELPKVDEIGCSLQEDVIRRDFTVNSIAMSLNQNDFGEIIDYFNGIEDIKADKIRILHENSFIDDPTRIIRALKFKVRFGFEVEESTHKAMQETLESGKFDGLCGERVKSEVRQTFDVKSSEAFKLFIDEKIYKLIDKDIKIEPYIFSNINSTLEKYNEFIFERWLIYMTILFANFEPEKIEELSSKLNLSNNDKNIIVDFTLIIKQLGQVLNFENNFEIYETFKKYKTETLVALAIFRKDLQKYIDIYLKELKDVKVSISGNDVMLLGIEEGPQVGEILNEVLKEKLNKKLSTKEEEIEFVKKNFIN